MAKSVEFEAEAPDGTMVRFFAPADSTEEQLKRYALIEYKARIAKQEPPPRAAEGRPAPAPTEPMAPDAQAMPEPPAIEPPGAGDMGDLAARVEEAARQQEIRQGQLAGAAVGAGIGGVRAGKELAGQAAQSLGERTELGRIAARQAAGIPSAPDQTARILQGTPGDIAGTTGRARSTGFNIETAQQAARTREAEQLLGGLQRQGAVGRSGSQILADMPGMTSSPSGVIYPRGTPPPTTVPPRPSGLDQVGSMFKSMMGPVSTAAKFAVPPLALATAAGEGLRARQLTQQEQPDPTGAALAGTMATSGLAALSPRLAPVAVPLGLGAAAVQYARGRLAPDEHISRGELDVASRPAFGYYPHLGRRRPRTVSP